MNTGPDRTQPARVANIGSVVQWAEAATLARRRLLWLPAALMVGWGVWALMAPSEGNVGQNKPGQSDLASTQPKPAAIEPDSMDVATRETAELDRLRISSQSWRRGGLGSKALVTFTLRNDNDYAVKDVEILCSFTRPDGSHLTDRSRLLADTVSMKSRKTFAYVPVGFVNVNANQAECRLVAARRL